MCGWLWYAASATPSNARNMSDLNRDLIFRQIVQLPVRRVVAAIAPDVAHLELEARPVVGEVHAVAIEDGATIRKDDLLARQAMRVFIRERNFVSVQLNKATRDDEIEQSKWGEEKKRTQRGESGH